MSTSKYSFNNKISDTSINVIDNSSNFIDDTITLDIAVLCQEYSPISVACSEKHIIELDIIDISENIFKQIFYPYGENFSLEKKNCEKYYPYVTFQPPFRTHNGTPFSLLEHVILKIEDDLGVTRNCFDTCSLIELSKELSNIKSLCDIDCCCIMGSLPWSNIKNIITNDYINKNYTNTSRKVILVISVIFKTPNVHILPITIKFKYKLNVNI